MRELADIVWPIRLWRQNSLACALKLTQDRLRYGLSTQLDVARPTDYLATTYTGAHWPDTALTPLNSAPCAQLGAPS